MEISLPAIQKTITTVFQRYHVILFVLLATGGLMATVLTLSGIAGSTSESDGYVSTANSTRFDQATIDRINGLKSRDQNNGTIDFSKGRTNPFVE